MWLLLLGWLCFCIVILTLWHLFCVREIDFGSWCRGKKQQMKQRWQRTLVVTEHPKSRQTRQQKSRKFSNRSVHFGCVHILDLEKQELEEMRQRRMRQQQQQQQPLFPQPQQPTETTLATSAVSSPPPLQPSLPISSSAAAATLPCRSSTSTVVEVEVNNENNDGESQQSMVPPPSPAALLPITSQPPSTTLTSCNGIGRKQQHSQVQTRSEPMKQMGAATAVDMEGEERKGIWCYLTKIF